MIGAEDRDVAQPELPPHRGDRGQADQPRPGLSGAEKQQVSKKIFYAKNDTNHPAIFFPILSPSKVSMIEVS